MSEDYKIKLENVTKEYDLYQSKNDKLKTFFSLKKRHEVPHFWSLKGISLEVHQGEALGIIGVNGSGKSTISNIISGIIPQTTGFVDVKGDTSIVAISAGLKWSLTGLENIRLKGLMQGLTFEEIAAVREDIIEFADIGDFINQPVKDYSSGMRSRLGFAIAVHINPDILIIDEALSVGDDTFYQKCLKKIQEFKKEGKTIVFVSHSLKQVEMLCDRVAWIHFGELREIGDTKKTVNDYRKFSSDFKKVTSAERSKYQKDKKQLQLDFDIDAYEKSIVQKEQEDHGTSEHEAARKVHKNFYSEVLPTKMTTLTKWLIGVAAVIMVFFALVTVSGHSITKSISDPSVLMHPTYTKTQNKAQQFK
ncbi:Teichoic acid export ATP-binding protein TagH [Pediococcus damnosus]|uniref:Teichoic acid export ATP-binding protein TagH n=1 Tax=Pediococcus damnosus TaxID=51663 RepID=A0A0R2H553_9LACO|nr:ABC transporter ATP-binding protein [Pediococcus damnosus]AMV60277.1 Teichoic acid export ATP-binding protein TagH [Pediococcus damnosus]AMV62808.1 Teichoic acid export ATP-binding protein TagH [Pediococcus damnosus]AMV64527.1 Teichoic acid export ATP-binding protein TagH [Pediococcus damnosus]AMV67307.1 Teichoic acid export ATP-binding protein TagH [Pediococcus damnosus]AMV69612.1 Teichoic acid export ATP-binding protein TagH [Pediococcus damnosus]